MQLQVIEINLRYAYLSIKIYKKGTLSDTFFLTLLSGSLHYKFNSRLTFVFQFFEYSNGHLKNF